MASATLFALFFSKTHLAAIFSCSLTGAGAVRHKTYTRDLVTIVYRWHPLHGQQIAVTRRVAGNNGESIHIDAEARFCRDVPAWMIDVAYCTQVNEGEPQVDVECLRALREFVDAQGIESDHDGASNGAAGEEIDTRAKINTDVPSGHPRSGRADPMAAPGRAEKRARGGGRPAASRSTKRARQRSGGRR